MTKAVLSREEAERRVVNYLPQKFPQTIAKEAVEFVSLQKQGEAPSDFQIDRLVAQQTGVFELEQKSLDDRIEIMVLERLKDLQEAAYKEAYQLGLDDGRERAFQELTKEFEEKLETFEKVLNRIESFNHDLLEANEAQLIRLLYHMARNVVLDEVQERPELILKVLEESLAGAQGEQGVTVHLSPSDLEFVESLKDRIGKNFESVKQIKLMPSEKVNSGGCIVETNFGVVDATLEQRLNKLWTTVFDKIPPVKAVIGDGQ